MVYIAFSHILTFSMLFIASIFDVRSEKGDVPDVFSITAIIGGVLLHSAYSFSTGSWNPLIYCLAVGGIFSVYGWLAYWKGMWGGADALALSALGFGAPFLTFSVQEVALHSVNMLMNIVVVSLVYSLAFSAVKAYRTENFTARLMEVLEEKKLLAAAVLTPSTSLFLIVSFPESFILYKVVVAFLALFLFMKTVEEHSLTEEVDVEELEGGEVLKSERIRGVTEEELENMEGTVQVVEGMRFMPVFPAAIVLTDAGFSILHYIVIL